MRYFERDGYSAFDWPHLDLGRLLYLCPELVVGNFVVVLALDSGPLVLSEEERRSGWTRVDELAFSPRISSPDQLPRAGYDEWFVFEAPIAQLAIKPFVNFGGFTPIESNSEDYIASAELWREFWAQVLRHRPLSVIGHDGGCYLVTRQSAVAAKLRSPLWQ